MTPQELKNSILQLAIQGKLVEQRQEEGSAEGLYRQIQAEKLRLVKAGKIKKEKPLPEIAEDEIPFEIPESWKWVRIGKIFNLQAGKNITSADIFTETSPEHPYRCYGGNGCRGYVSNYNREGHYALIGRQGALCGNINYAEGKFYATEHAVVVEQFAGTSVFWAGYFLQALNLNQYATATAQPGLAVANINQVPIPLPPLAEQKRIVSKIEELLPLLVRYEQAWTKLEAFNTRFPSDLQKSLLQLAIQGKLVEQRPEEGTGEDLWRKILATKSTKKSKKEKPLPEITEDDIPFDIPESWKWVRLGQIGQTNIGLTYTPKDVRQEGVIVLRSSNIHNGKMDYADLVKVSCQIPENKMCHIGDILICARNGSKRLVGKAALVDREGMSFGAFMAVFRSECNPFILFVINSAYFRNSLLGDTGTTTINQITQDMMKNVLVPLPPLAEQKRIVAKLEELLPLCESLNQ